MIPDVNIMSHNKHCDGAHYADMVYYSVLVLTGTTVGDNNIAPWDCGIHPFCFVIVMSSPLRHSVGEIEYDIIQ